MKARFDEFDEVFIFEKEIKKILIEEVIIEDGDVFYKYDVSDNYNADYKVVEEKEVYASVEDVAKEFNALNISRLDFDVSEKPKDIIVNGWYKNVYLHQVKLSFNAPIGEILEISFASKYDDGYFGNYSVYGLDAEGQIDFDKKLSSNHNEYLTERLDYKLDATAQEIISNLS